MPIIDPYETTYGKVINKSKLIKDVQDYIVRSNDKLNYEYTNTGDIDLAIITGFNSEERNLSLFEHPLLVKGLRQKDIVAIDVRKFVKPHDEQQTVLEDVVKDSAGFKFNILRALITADFIAHNYGSLRQIYSGITMSYAAVVSSLINYAINLNPQELLDTELGCAYFANTLFVDQEDLLDVKNNIIARLSNFRYSLPVSKTAVNNLLSDVLYSSQDIYGLLGLLKQLLPDEKAELLNDALLVNLLSNAWFGPGGSESLLIGLEHIPTWIAIAYVSLDNLTYKRSKIATILNKYSKSIDPKDYVKEIDNYIKEKL